MYTCVCVCVCVCLCVCVVCVCISQLTPWTDAKLVMLRPRYVGGDCYFFTPRQLQEKVAEALKLRGVEATIADEKGSFENLTVHAQGQLMELITELEYVI